MTRNETQALLVKPQPLPAGKKRPIVAGYVVLLILSLGVPLLHHYLTDRAIDAMRPALKLPNGSVVPMLLPSHILLLRWLGQLSCIIPIGVIVAFAFSLGRNSFSRPAALCIIAVWQCTFTTLYALYAAFLLGMEWLHLAG